MPNFLGKRIRELRKSKNIIQSELAKMINVDSKYISRLETGTSNPSLETINNIADKLGVEVAELFKYSHLQKNDLLIEEIIKILKSTTDKNVKLIYQITKDIVNGC